VPRESGRGRQRKNQGPHHSDNYEKALLKVTQPRVISWHTPLPTSSKDPREEPGYTRARVFKHTRSKKLPIIAGSGRLGSVGGKESYKSHLGARASLASSRSPNSSSAAYRKLTDSPGSTQIQRPVPSSHSAARTSKRELDPGESFRMG